MIFATLAHTKTYGPLSRPRDNPTFNDTLAREAWESDSYEIMIRASSNHHLLLRRGDSLLVIVDMQERLVPVMEQKDSLVKNVCTLVKCSNLFGIPVVVTEQQKLGDTIQEIREELGGISPVEKVEFDCFRSEAFRRRLADLGKQVLVLVGIEAHICVTQTALHAVRDYQVHVVSDAVSSRSLENKRVALDRMTQAGVILSSTEMAIFELLEKAGTDTFKEVLKLVK